jgi:hypothetical protein
MEDVMKLIRITAVAAVFALAGTIGIANAQDATPPQTQPGDGYTMGPWMMGPGGMMNNGATGPYMMGQYGGMPMMGWGGHGAAMCGMTSSHIDGRLAYQKAELKITPTQESLWNAYAKAAHENADAMTAHCTAMMDSASAQALSLPDRLDQHEKFMETQIDAMKNLNKTLKPLYATFSDAQKKAADQMIWGPMGMM